MRACMHGCVCACVRVPMWAVGQSETANACEKEGSKGVALVLAAKVWSARCEIHDLFTTMSTDGLIGSELLLLACAVNQSQ